MGKRREPRSPQQLTVRILGSDAEGRTFSQNVTTTNVSRMGVRVQGLEQTLKVGDIVGVMYGGKKARFRVQWMGGTESAATGQAGLESVTPETRIWDIVLPAAIPDNYAPSGPAHGTGPERRTAPRMRCEASVELYPSGQGTIRARIVDLSQGGCFVEMPIPLPRGTRIKLGLWLGDLKLHADAVVNNSRPGFGIGIQFLDISEEDRQRLKDFLDRQPRLRL
jgi:hypothetical protein